MAWRSLALLLVLAACAGAPEAERPVTVEEAGFLAKGHLFEVYGEEADPVLAEVLDARVEELDGRPVWVLDTRVEVTEDGRREARVWRFRVGLADGRPVVLQAAELDPGSR